MPILIRLVEIDVASTFYVVVKSVCRQCGGINALYSGDFEPRITAPEQVCRGLNLKVNFKSGLRDLFSTKLQFDFAVGPCSFHQTIWSVVACGQFPWGGSAKAQKSPYYLSALGLSANNHCDGHPRPRQCAEAVCFTRRASRACRNRWSCPGISYFGHRAPQRLDHTRRAYVFGAG